MGAPPVGDRETGADSRRCASRDAPNRSERTAAGRPAPCSFTTRRAQGDIWARSRDSRVRMPTNDADLVARARAGDADAYAALLRRHQRALARVCGRMLGDPVAAADVAQDAALVAWLQLDRLREPERFGAWLAGIGRVLSLRARRERHAAPTPSDSLPERAADERDQPVERVLARERAHELAQAIASLP